MSRSVEGEPQREATPPLSREQREALAARMVARSTAETQRRTRLAVRRVVLVVTTASLVALALWLVMR